MSLYGDGPSPFDIGFSGWGAQSVPAAPGATTFSLPGGTYGAGSAVPDTYSGSFGGFNPAALFGSLGGVINTGLDIWDRLDNDDNPMPQVQSTQPVLAGSMSPIIMVAIGGAVLAAFVMMRK